MEGTYKPPSTILISHLLSLMTIYDKINLLDIMIYITEYSSKKLNFL